MDKDLLISYIDAAEQSSYSSERDSQLSTDRAFAIDLYNGTNVDPVPEGRSSVIDRSVFETIQWIQPSLCRIFANGDDVIEIVPQNAEDEAGAKQETAYLNHVILQKNNWFETFITWSTDALLTKNGYCIAYSEERLTNEVERYERQTEMGVKMLMQDEVEVETTNAYPDPDSGPQPVIGPDGQPQMELMGIDPMGQPVMQPVMQQPMLYDVEVKRTKKDKKICIKVLPPERCKISYRTPSFRINDECPYFEYFDYKTYSDLKADGFKLPKDIPDSWAEAEEEDLARDLYQENTWQESNEPDPAMKRYRCRMIWIRADLDEDGLAELVYCVRIGNDIIFQEQVSRIPVAALACIPNAHRHVATSVADIVGDIQRIKTAILRQGLDNLYLANNARTFVNDKINLDDVLVSVPGGVVRGGPGSALGIDVGPMPTPFVFPQAMEGLEYMDQVRENRTGTNRYFTGIDQNAMNKTATGIQQLSTMAAQRVEQIARVMATGVEDLFSIVHELILKGGHKKDKIRLNNEWVDIDPAQWRKRTDFRISVGYAAGNKDAMMARLMTLAQMQEKALLAGLPIVSPENMYETAIEITKASDFSAPQRFWTNPKSAPPKGPPQPDVTVVAAEQIKSQTALQAKQMDVEQKERDSQRDFEIKRYEIEMGAQVQAGLALHQTEQQKELKQIEGQQTAQLEDRRAGNALQAESFKTQAKEKANTQVSELAAVTSQLLERAEQIGQALDQVMGSIKQLSQIATGARRVVKGKSGKAEAIEVLGEDGNPIHRANIIRGPNGIEGAA